MLRIRAAVAAFTLALAATQLNAQIVNGGFETGSLSPWSQGLVLCTLGPLCVPWSVTTAEAHSGTYSAVDQGNIGLRQDFGTPILGSDITSFKFWMMQNVNVIAAFDFYYTDGTYDEDVLFPTDSDWQQFDVLSLIDPTKTIAGFGVYGETGVDPNFTYVDDFSMTTGVPSTVPEPASMALLATGLVGMVGTGLRRRKTA